MIGKERGDMSRQDHEDGAGVKHERISKLKSTEDEVKTTKGSLSNQCDVLGRPGKGNGHKSKGKKRMITKNKDSGKKSKFKNVTLRIWWSVIMLAVGACVFSSGITLYCTLLGIIYFVYKEFISLKIVILPEKESIMQKILQWYLFHVILIYGAGDLLVSNIWPKQGVSAFLSFFLVHKTMFLFLSYCLSLITFVLSLRKSYYRQQFLMFAWMSTGLLLVWCEVYSVSKTLKLGPVWVLLPIILVIINDSAAYFFGQLLGSTPLIKVSPKKTWEGFIGGFLATMVCSIFISKIFTRYPYMYCPDWTLARSIFSNVTCDKDPLYVNRIVPLPSFVSDSPLATFLRNSNIADLSHVVASPFQLHSLLISFFVSLVAPFAGFLASGLKRGLKIKDFSNTIPGHGGVIDRVDCHLITLMFVFVYHQSFIRIAKHSGVGPIAKYVIRKLSVEQINELITILTSYTNSKYI